MRRVVESSDQFTERNAEALTDPMSGLQRSVIDAVFDVEQGQPGHPGLGGQPVERQPGVLA